MTLGLRKLGLFCPATRSSLAPRGILPGGTAKRLNVNTNQKFIITSSPNMVSLPCAPIGTTIYFLKDICRHIYLLHTYLL